MVEGLVSVIMPSYNTGSYISKSIESVLGQTYKDFELLIVDDCSSDDTDEAVRPYLSDPRIKYFKNECNQGAALSRNRALREARGEWIAFLDSDDLWAPSKLERQLSFMKENGYAFSYHEYSKIDEKGDSLNIHVSGPKVVGKRKMYHYDYVGCLSFMYESKTMGLIQVKDIKKNNDYAILLQAVKKAPCFLLKEDLASYRIRKRSISHDKLSKKLRSHYDLFRICDGRNVLVSLWFACWNMFFGVCKKIRYEKRAR